MSEVRNDDLKKVSGGDWDFTYYDFGSRVQKGEEELKKRYLIRPQTNEHIKAIQFAEIYFENNIKKCRILFEEFSIFKNYEYDEFYDTYEVYNTK